MVRRMWWVLLLAWGADACAQPPCASPVFEAQGHRGGRARRPENSLAAMEYALSRGVTTLEMDVAVTRDEVLVLAHEPWLPKDRCLDPDGNPAADVPINTLTLAQLSRYDCGSLKHKDFPDQVTVPGPLATLREVFAVGERLSGARIHYNIEPKMDPADDDKTPSAERFMDLLLADIEGAGVHDRVIIQSFDARPLRELVLRGSTLKRAFLWPTAQPSVMSTVFSADPLTMADALGAEILSSYDPVTTRPLVDAAHARGVAVVPWTVNKRDRMAKLVDMGVDGLISDDPDLLMEVVREKKPTRGVCW
ncbi:MAG: glycerophosphodiester phosphodiesterase [Deltaproteobacteria bacterium]|nr:glycerophosphodiester phosphodiesterase [Deltaproteobacteria bacterium]